LSADRFLFAHAHPHKQEEPRAATFCRVCTLWPSLQAKIANAPPSALGLLFCPLLAETYLLTGEGKGFQGFNYFVRKLSLS
jgi:hypothetical protein